MMNNRNNVKKVNKILEFKNSSNVSSKVPIYKLKVFLILVFLLLIALTFRIAYLQFVSGKKLKKEAFAQLSYTETILAKRGSIYDSTGMVLATSYDADNVVVVPSEFEEDEKALAAAVLASIFELDTNEVLEQLNSSKNRITLIKNVSQDKVDVLEDWIKNSEFSHKQIYTEDTVARYYPYSTLASNVIGFCGTDSQGLSGVEYSWDSVLTGTAGKSISSKDASQSQIPNTEETYIPAENGYDLTLTIDVNIQSIVEKYLKQAVEENDCNRGGTTIVMDPSTGDILAMASYPDFDLNSPFTPNSYISEGWDKLSTSQKSNLLQRMWNNKCITDTYEPGSVFKTITAAVALEENIVDVDTKSDFYCSGVEVVADRNIKCWRKKKPHQAQSLRDAYNNSCNPAFIQLGKMVGTTTLYKYYDAFGFFAKTGVSLSGESAGIFFDIDDVGPVQLATMSFGQRFTITPLQMISSISALVNGGNLMQPRIVKSITNTDTSETTTIATTKIRQVVSSDTSEKIKSMMQSEVEVGTGKRGLVAGYSVGGKTGTSEPSQTNTEEGYVASFVGIGPVENTKIVVLTCLYDPQGKSHQGGEIAAPVVSKIFSEVLPYLGVSSNTDKSNIKNNTSDNNLY